MTDALAPSGEALGKREDMIVHEADPYNAEPPPTALAGSPLTPADTFYVRSHGPIPRDGAPLRVGGLVARELDLGPDQLAERFGVRHLEATLQCAGNRRAGLLSVRAIPGEAPWGPGATGNAVWTGAPLADVIAAAGAAPEARYVEFVGADVSQEAQPPQRFGASIPLHKALSGEVRLAWAMNDSRSPRHTGLRCVPSCPATSARSVKWLTEVSLLPEPSATSFRPRPTGCCPPTPTPTPACVARGSRSGRSRSTPTSCHPPRGPACPRA